MSANTTTNSTNKRVAKAAGIVMGAILLSRILGFVRERAIAEVFGRTWETDVFFAAFALPDLMYQLLVGGALSSAFIPVFTQYLANDDEKQAWYVASTFINLTVVLLLVFMVLGSIFTPILAPLVGVGFVGEQRELLILLMRITFPAVFFTAISGLAMGVLNSYQSFTRPAMGPLVYNASQITGAYLLGPSLGVKGMAIGTIFGSIGSFLLQFPEVLKRAAKHYRFVIDFRHPGVRKMARLMLPAIIGLSIAQINLIVAQNLASLLDTGSIVALRLANRLINFPLGVFAMGISNAIFPTLTRMSARGETSEFKRTVSFGLRVVLYITIPSAIGMAALRVPIVRLLFESGEFTAADTQATAFALLFYSFGLFAQAALQILTRIFHSLYDTVTPVKVGLSTVVINLILSLILLKGTNLGHGGLALSFSITSFLNMAIYLVILRKRLGSIDGRRIATTFVKAFGASMVMGVVAYQTAAFLGGQVDLARGMGRLIQTMGGILAGAVTYLVLSFLFKMEEVLFVWNMIKERFTSKKRKTGDA